MYNNNKLLAQNASSFARWLARPVLLYKLPTKRRPQNNPSNRQYIRLRDECWAANKKRKRKKQPNNEGRIKGIRTNIQSPVSQSQLKLSQLKLSVINKSHSHSHSRVFPLPVWGTRHAMPCKYPKILTTNKRVCSLCPRIKKESEPKINNRTSFPLAIPN